MKGTVTNEIFINRVMLNNKGYQNKDFNIVTSYINRRNKIIVEDKYGMYLMSPSSLIKGILPTIFSAANKTKHIISRFKEIHDDIYNYNKVHYENMHKKVKISCSIHGSFSMVPNAHLNGQGCPECGTERSRQANLQTEEEFLLKSKNKHGDKFNYNNIKYVNSVTKIDLHCNTHDINFKQTPFNHLKWGGCIKCKRDKLSKSIIERGSGWNYSNWKKLASKSKNFDSFKVYVIKCWNDNEIFYKIGKTFSKIEYRFKSKSSLPYKFEVLYTKIGEAREISDLERVMQKENKKYKYRPNLSFRGEYECFNKLIEYEWY